MGPLFHLEFLSHGMNKWYNKTTNLFIHEPFPIIRSWVTMIDFQRFYNELILSDKELGFL
jgi:hypothetical protein